MNKRNIDFSVRRTIVPIQKKPEIISILPLKSDQYYYVDDIVPFSESGDHWHTE